MNFTQSPIFDCPVDYGKTLEQSGARFVDLQIPRMSFPTPRHFNGVKSVQFAVLRADTAISRKDPLDTLVTTRYRLAYALEAAQLCVADGKQVNRHILYSYMPALVLPWSVEIDYVPYYLQMLGLGRGVIFALTLIKDQNKWRSDNGFLVVQNP